MNQNQRAGIYKISCLANGRVYVGQSTDVDGRIKDHIRRLKNNTHDNKRIQHAFNKYGLETFCFEVIERCRHDFDVLNEREIYWIRALDSLNKKTGFNIAAGGSNGYSMSGMTDEEKKIVFEKSGRIRREKYSGENAPNYGKRMSDAQKQKISIKLSGSNNLWFGVKRPDHSIRMTGSGNPRARPVICINTGERFECAKDAGRKYQTTNSNILKCCKSKQSFAGRNEDGVRLVWACCVKEEEDDKQGQALPPV